MGLQREKKYIIERSIDQIHWKHIASFEEGQPSRWGNPFDQDTALAEAIGYRDRKRESQQKEFVRVIIEL